MKISRLLIARFAILTGTLVLVGALVSLAIFVHAFATRLNASMNVQAVSAEGIASQTYSQGNLIALRGGLDSIASIHRWSSGQFKNDEGEIVWSYIPTNAGIAEASVLDRGLWYLMHGWMRSFSSDPFLLSHETTVQDLDGHIVGTLSFAQDASEPWKDFTSIVFLICVGAALVWILFIVVCWFVSHRTLKPMSLLLEDLRREAEKISLDFLDAKGDDELIRIRIWFRDLALAWLEARDKLVKSQRDAAIARTTQMLAHDVRKPFSILKMGMHMLGKARDPAGIKAVVARLMPEIERAVQSVDGLLSDVMEIGSEPACLMREPVSPESLIESTLGEVFRIYPRSSIEIMYDMHHFHMVDVHVQKVKRVFSNILVNAIQAINLHGAVWFKTLEQDGWIEFCMGNSDSWIPAEHLPKLFEAFFTSGKKGGTGLGLAIAQKVVNAHGGSIWCESSKSTEHPKGKVEFFFTLPIASDQKCKTTASLAKHSTEIVHAINSIASIGNDGSDVDKGELTLEDEIVHMRIQSGRVFRILVVDDERVYQNALGSYLTRTSELVDAVQICQVENSDDALKAVNSEKFDLVITDVDMGANSADGFELVKALRQMGVRSLICIHSNRVVPAYHKVAIEVGADAYLPKPMARAQLLRLLLQAAAIDMRQI